MEKPEETTNQPEGGAMARSRTRYRAEARASSSAAPLVYKKRKKKKKRKRYSRGLRDIQRAENQFTKSANRLTRATRRLSGDPLTRAAREWTTTYRRRRKKSARKRRDGALTDIVNNVFDSSADALGLVVPFVSGAVSVITRTRFRAELVRQVRATTRRLVRPFR